MPGFTALYFGNGNGNGDRGVVYGDNASSYVPAYAAVWMRGSGPRSTKLKVVLDGSLQTFNYSETLHAIADAARTLPFIPFIHHLVV